MVVNERDGKMKQLILVAIACAAVAAPAEASRWKFCGDLSEVQKCYAYDNQDPVGTQWAPYAAKAKQKVKEVVVKVEEATVSVAEQTKKWWQVWK